MSKKNRHIYYSTYVLNILFTFPDDRFNRFIILCMTDKRIMVEYEIS